MWMCLGVAVKELGGITADSGWCIVRGARLAHLLARRALAAATPVADTRDTNSTTSSSSSTVGTVQEAERRCVLKALWAVVHILKSMLYSGLIQ